MAEEYADGLATEQQRAAVCAAANELDWQIAREEGEGDSARAMANCASMSASNDDNSFLLGVDEEEDFRAAEDSSYCAAHTFDYRFTGTSHKSNARRAKALQNACNREFAAQAEIVRCIFGNPFRTITVATAFQTPTVVSLAHAAYDERHLPSGELDPHRRAVLADALEEAGAAEELIAHLRSPSPHVRGCWVVDLILGKE